MNPNLPNPVVGCRLHSPPALTQLQRQDMERLWFLQTTKDNVANVANAASSSSKDPRSGGAGGLVPMDDKGFCCLTRLHAFFLSFLQKHCRQCHDNDDHDNDTHDDNNVAAATGNDTQQPTVPLNVSTDEKERLKFLKENPRESCLEPYFSLFLGGPGSHLRLYGGGGNSGSRSGSSSTFSGGRSVMTMHYDAFLEEMNRFEFRLRDEREKVPAEMLARESFGAYLHFFPLQALPAVNVAMALAVASLWRTLYTTEMTGAANNGTSSSSSSSPPSIKLHRFLESCHLTVRFIHVAPQLPMADVKTGLVKKFISIKGHVIKARPRRLRVTWAEFSCQKCSAVLSHSFEKGRFSVPTKCSNPSCRSRSFALRRPTTRYTNVQELRLQEAQEESTTHAGRTPRQLEVELTDDLIDSCRPGDIILLACHVDVVNSAIAAGRAGKRAQETSTYKLFLQGHSITSLSETNRRGGSGQGQSSADGSSQTTFTQPQLQNIVRLCHADHRCLGEAERRAFPFDLLVRSLCPSIIGHHSVKAGILLCLLGGTPPASQQMDRGATIRSNSHILIVGDPGMGKSQMLLAATQLAARSVYVGGNTSSTTGLTVTMTKEEGGETGIEAGALVLADQGVACIDELDKCKHLDGLLEAMEQQSVSIAKAGVVASLPSRCSVIAAANPKHGSYNMSKTVAENLNMARPILSRFDLIFILRDRADKEQDRLVSSNIINMYRTRNEGGTLAGFGNMMAMDPANDPLYGTHAHDENDGNSGDFRIPMEKRLAWVASFNEPLPADLVRDYIAYAREYCKPKLSREAALILRDYYLSLRYPADGRRAHDTVPITTRQLEALIRLSQARAKACLRELVLEEDARDVVELLKYSNIQVHTDEFGNVDKTRAGPRGQSNRKVRKEYVKKLYEIIGGNAECDRGDLLRVADHVQMGRSDFETALEELRLNGTILLQSNGRYKVLA